MMTVSYPSPPSIVSSPPFVMVISLSSSFPTTVSSAVPVITFWIETPFAIVNPPKALEDKETPAKLVLLCTVESFKLITVSVVEEDASIVFIPPVS